MKQKKNDTTESRKPDHPLIAILKFVPLFVFAGLVLFLKFDLLIAAPIASFVAA